MCKTRKITQIKPQKRDKKRRNVFLDDTFAFGLDAELVIKYSLHEGDIINEVEITQLLHAEERKGAKDRALRFLSYRARSEKEIRDKLLKIGTDTAVISWVISDLKRIGLVDDQKFSLSYIRDKMALRPIGPLAIRKELKRLGIAEELIEFAIEEAFREKSALEVASELIQKRFLQIKHLEWEKIQKRLADFLYRRGFNWGVIQEALDTLKQEDTP